MITAAATTSSGATGVARVSVIGDLVGGTTILDVTDPAGDDNGPGTYQYPTSSNFAPGSFDITRFQVLQQGDTVYLRTTLKNLVETFGSPDGAQLLDVYVHQPGATPTSTDAAFTSRNYTIAADDAWSQRLEVQGFAGPVWQDANGDQVGTVSGVVASPAAKTITIALPAVAARYAGLRLVVQRGAHRPGRVLRRPGAGLHPHPAGVPVRRLRGRRPVADLLGRPRHRGQGRRRDHAGGCLPGHRARPDRRARRSSTAYRCPDPGRLGARVRSGRRSDVAVWSQTATFGAEKLRFGTNRRREGLVGWPAWSRSQPRSSTPASGPPPDRTAGSRSPSRRCRDGTSSRSRSTRCG